MPLPTIVSGNVASATAGAYEVANSCRFSDPGTSYMHKTPGSAGDQTEYTYSCWVKRGTLLAGSGTNQTLLESGTGGSNYSSISFYHSGSLSTNGSLDWHSYNSGYAYRLRTNRKFLDCSAWYHFVFAFDSDQGTDADKMKLWVNGVQETSFLYDTYPSAQDAYINADEQHAIGYDVHQTTNYYLDGYLAEVCFIDGQQLAPTDFGEFDEDSPTIWKPKDVSGLTFGTNGFYLDFKDSANLGNDANGGTDLTEVNLAAADQCVDSPTNNFATFNPIARNPSDTGSLSEGNVKYGLSSYTYNARSTIGVNNGKWYFEVKITGTAGLQRIGICTSNINDNLDTDNTDFIYGGVGRGAIANIINSGGNTTGTTTITDTSYSQTNRAGYVGTAWATDDILMCAFDLDNNRIYWGEGGTWYNSSNPADGTNPISISNSGGDPWHVFGGYGTSSARSCEWNFGCPSFALSSAAADGNGYGAFEYAPPSGYYALCTKNLAEYGG